MNTSSHLISSYSSPARLSGHRSHRSHRTRTAEAHNFRQHTYTGPPSTARGWGQHLGGEESGQPIRYVVPWQRS